MAYTSSFLKKTVLGDQRVHGIRITADAATQAVNTGLSKIDWISYAPQSCTTAAIKFAINELCAGTASAGYVGISGAASGDEMILTVFGV